MEIVLTIISAIGGVSGIVAICSLPWLVKQNKAEANVKTAAAEEAVIKNYDEYVLKPIQQNYSLIMKSYQDLLAAVLKAKDCRFATLEDCPVMKQMKETTAAAVLQ